MDQSTISRANVIEISKKRFSPHTEDAREADRWVEEVLERNL